MINRLLVLSIVFALASAAQNTSQPQAVVDSSTKTAGGPQPDTNPAAETEPAVPETPAASRTALNLAGQTDTGRGEARRNENVQFNLVDTNAARELNRRIGVTATLFDEFSGDRGYFGTEFGNAPRGPIHVVAQRAGAKGFHGNIFWNHNNSVFSARSFFQVGSVRPARANQYGAAFGIQPWRGAFFTFNGSQEKNRGNVNGNVLIPLPSERTPLATDPATRALVQKSIDAFPNVLPNRRDIAERALNTNAPQTINTDSATGQLTQQLRANQTLSARYVFTGQDVQAFQLIRGSNPNTVNKSHSARLSWNRALDARTVLTATLGFERQRTILSPAPDSPITTAVIGYSLLGPTPTIPINRTQNRFRYAASAARQHNRHAFIAGFSTTRLQYNGTEDEAGLGIFQYRGDFGRDGITNFRLGTASSYSITLGTTYRAFRNWESQLFFADKWTLNNAVTLNYSLRYEPFTVPTDATGRSHLQFDSDWNNLAPSLGFGWRLPGKSGVVRGAYGIMFGQIFPVTYGFDRFQTPYSFRLAVQAPSLTNPLAGFNIVNPGNIPTNNLLVSPDLATPYSQQYNFSWERVLPHDWRLQLGYVGSRSVKLFASYMLNRGQPVNGIPFTTATTNLRRADQRKLEENLLNNANRGYYDAARVTLTIPRWHGLGLNTSYWFGKAIDLGTDYNATGADLQSRRAGAQYEFESVHDMKALSAFDQPHALLVQGNYELPRIPGKFASSVTHGWSINAVGLLKNGTPFIVDTGSDGPGFGNVDGTVGDRPMLLDPSILGRTIGNPDTSQQLLPRSAFRYINAPRELAGNLGRNVFRRGKIANINASLSRNWVLSQERQLNLRVESINLFNTPQFAEPGFSLTSPNFGQITNTLNDGRTFRFQLRLAF